MIFTIQEIIKTYKRKLISLYHLFIPAKPVYHRLSYSQEGEDLILARMFEGKTNGFYVDVGAHHPKRFSNTYYFYLQGWKGINIDAMPGSMNIFKKIRSRDINLEIPISNTKQILTYYAFDEPALNGFCKDIADKHSKTGVNKIIFEENMETHPLSEVLDQYIPQGQIIDFLTVDVEGLEYQILSSNNWERYKPKIILVEDLQESSIEEIMQSKLITYLSQKEYLFHCKTVNTLFFIYKN